MSILEAPRDDIIPTQIYLKSTKEDQSRTRTPFIITLFETNVTIVDIQNFIEAGLRTVRFRIQITKENKLTLLSMMKTAMSWCCEKYDVSAWPIALSVDIPNACIKTGVLLNKEIISIIENSTVELTSDVKFYNMCTTERIFIDDPYALESLKPSIEITLCFGEIVMICTEVIDSKSVLCNVIRGGDLTDEQIVCIRGIKHLKPPLSKKDLELIAFAKESKCDIITVNSIRYPSTLKKIKQCFPEDERPLLVSTICEQEGLDNIDDIIEESDGIILAREFLAHEIRNKHLMTIIQLQLSGKCRKVGKPFYISGNILESTLQKGRLAAVDLNDITNAVLQRAGFVLRQYKDQNQLTKVITILNSICKFVEPLADTEEFWRMHLEFKIPVNAAEAAVLASALLVKKTDSYVIIVPTVTGKTAKQLCHIAPDVTIITITSNPRVARQLQLYRGVVSIIYDKNAMKNWHEEIDARIKFAIAFGVKNNILKYGQTYVALKKALPTSSFCDHISIWTVTSKVDGKRPTCDD